VGSFERIERERWERHEVEQLSSATITETERAALVRARIGQGRFRENVASVEQACRVTGITNMAYLVASHIKPWRHAQNDERLSGNNGLMLAPHADFLFDRGFISFGDGRVLVSDVADPNSLRKLGIDPERPPETNRFNARQEEFLDFHRHEIFRKAR
jgi:predicted restriction endonuclease